MNYDITELFGNLPATAGSFEEMVEHKDHMIILGVNPSARMPKKDYIKFLDLIIDALNEDATTHPLLLECDNLQLQSFLSEEMNVRDFLQAEFDRILWDNAIFFNKNMIFTFYDLGADFRFFNRKDYEEFFKLCNRSHLITMASYVPEGETLSIDDNIARVNS